MGLCFSSCKGLHDGETGNANTTNARQDVEDGQIASGEEERGEQQIAKDEQNATENLNEDDDVIEVHQVDKDSFKDEDELDRKKPNGEDDPVIIDEEKLREDEHNIHVGNDDQIGNQVVEENKTVKDVEVVQVGQGDVIEQHNINTSDKQTHEVEDHKISEEEYFAQLCRKYSKDNPIPKEEAELFLKELAFPLPTMPHLTLSEDIIAGKRIFIIGDVHGCYDNLLALLHIADIDKDPNALMIFVGDIVNKGPKTCEVLNFVRSSNSYCVMGNHERSAVRKLRLMKLNIGYEPKASKQWLYDLDESDYEYLKELPYTISIPSLNAIIVHGGLLPGKPLEEHTQDEMLLMRNIIVEGKELKATKHITHGQLWGELWKGPQHVYFGHHSLEGLQRYPYATGLDTGCVYHGSLTGVFLTGDKKLVSVKNEGCRNEEVNQI
ncbi:uncharacterized protein LOC129254948 [Lytechinus pictus]|uniref:uncharacterized protein LOC129254948 n=1 Tax=Lytechinus pictus TaxID=7653 RepID=UPI0030B9AD84